MGDKEEPVYNIEVDRDHCYRVGECGLLVHNVSTLAAGACTQTGFIDYGDEDDWGVTQATSHHYSGRPRGVHALLTPSNLGRGTEASHTIRPPGWEEIDHPTGINRARGHLLGNQIGGSGTEPLNLVALYQRTANDPAMKTCENRIADTLRCGACVEVWITPRYGQNGGAPTAIRIRARAIDVGDINLDVSIQNSPAAQTPPQCRL
jgi:hypothetical protein